MSERLFRRRKSGRPSGPWIAQWYDADGKRHQRSTKLFDATAAEALQRQWERDGVDPAAAAAAAARHTTLADAAGLTLDAYRELVATGKRHAPTVDYYLRKIGQWRRVLGDGYKIATFDAAAVDGYVSTRRRDGVSEHTIKKELTALSITLQHARRAGRFVGEPRAILPVRFGAGYKPRERFLTVEQAAALLGVLASTPDHAARAAFSIATGARLAETVLAERVDVADDLATVRLRGTKTTSAARVVPVLEHARPLLRLAVERAEGPADGRLFARSADAFVQRLRAVTLDPRYVEAIGGRASANDLRRTCAQWLRARGATPDLIAPVLGHTTDRLAQQVYARPAHEQLARLLEAATGQGRRS